MNSYSKTEIFEFLDLVRNSGAINMYDGAKVLISEYGITRNEAREYLIEWMRTYIVAKPNEGED